MKILIAEDSKEIVRILEIFFKLTPHEIKVAWDGEEAYEMYKKEKFDLIITDYRMPKLDGLILLKMIKEENKDIPVILVSADKTFLKNDDSHLSTYIIKKPFSFNDIKQVIADVEMTT